MKKNKITILLITIFLVLIDQIIKLVVANNLNYAESINIIKNFFRITYVQNTGAAWSILTGSQVLLIIVTLLVLGAGIYYILKKQKISKLETIIYGVLLGGIIGNLTDRIIHGYVIDYLDFNFLNYNFPIFNLADTLIVVSGLVLILKTYKEGE